MSRHIWTLAVLLVGCALHASKSSQADDFIGQEFLPRAGARFAVGDRTVPPRKIGHPFIVKRIQGDWLWIGSAWINKTDVIPVAEAESYYNRYLESHPQSAWALHLRGLCKMRRKEIDWAIDDYSKAIELEPGFAVAYCKRGRALCELEQFSRGIEDLGRAVEIDPELIEAYWVRGFARVLDEQDITPAIQDLERAIELAPEDAYVISLRGAMFALAMDFDRAIEDLDRAIQLDPSDSKCFSNRAACWLAKQQHEQAMKDLNEAIRLDPIHATYYYNRAVVQVKTKDLSGFLGDLDRAIQIDPEYAAAHFLRFVALAMLGQSESWPVGQASLPDNSDIPPALIRPDYASKLFGKQSPASPR